MRRTTTIVSLVALSAAALAFSDPIVSPDAPAHCSLIRGGETETTDDDIEACRSDVWFHDQGTKVDNLDNATGTFAAWDTTPPAASVTEGAGGGALTTSALHQTESPWDERESFVAAGTVEGGLDAIAVELYLFPLQAMADGTESFRVDAELTIDGQSVATIADQTVPMEVAGDAVRRIQFAFTGLAESIEMFHGFGLVNPLGSSHDVELTVHGTGIGSNAAVFVYDTTEVPGGMVINPPAELLAELG